MSKTQDSKRFIFKCGRLAISEPGFLSIENYRKLFPKVSYKNPLSRIWFRKRFRAGDLLQISPVLGKNFAGCVLCFEMMVEDDTRVFGQVIVPSRQGAVSITAEFPVDWVRKVGRAKWSLSRSRAGL